MAKRRKKVIVGTGIVVEARSKAGKNIPEQEERKHLWNLIAVFRIGDPTAEQFDMDMENLVTIQGPGCYFCEQLYEKGMENTPCNPVV